MKNPLFGSLYLNTLPIQFVEFGMLKCAVLCSRYRIRGTCVATFFVLAILFAGFYRIKHALLSTDILRLTLPQLCIKTKRCIRAFLKVIDRYSSQSVAQFFLSIGIMLSLPITRKLLTGKLKCRFCFGIMHSLK